MKRQYIGTSFWGNRNVRRGQPSHNFKENRQAGEKEKGEMAPRYETLWHSSLCFFLNTFNNNIVLDAGPKLTGVSDANGGMGDTIIVPCNFVSRHSLSMSGLRPLLFSYLKQMPSSAHLYYIQLRCIWNLFKLVYVLPQIYDLNC